MSIQLEWLIFGILVFVLLALDLLIFNKKPHEVKFKEALGWSGFWIFLGLAFGGFVYYEHGSELALQYYAAYFMEKSLSIDNIFVFLMIFSFFKVAPMYQHKVLFWGIIGALAMRFIFIFLGIGLINTFDWILYVFGAVLIYSGYKMLKEKDSEYDPSKNKMISLFRKIMPVTDEFHEQKFFVRLNGVLHATPLFLVLLVIETSDVIFAVDSIPAVLAISKDSFVVYTSNIMAILGLRALYFAFSTLMKYFRYLNYGLSFILIFVGIKMIIAEWYHISTILSLSVISGTLLITILFSIFIKEKTEDKAKISEN